MTVTGRACDRTGNQPPPPILLSPHSRVTITTDRN
jgi:hypothetical protein